MTALYIASKLLTLPGAAVKVLWEHLAAKLTGILIEDPRCFQKNELCGHIEHRLTKKPAASFLFCFLPWLLNLLPALPMLYAAILNLFYFGVGTRDITSDMLSPLFFAYIVMLYLGVSLVCNLFPLYEDALNLWDILYVEKKAGIAARILLFIPSCIIMAGSFLEKYSISLFICIAAILAMIII